MDSKIDPCVRDLFPKNINFDVGATEIIITCSPQILDDQDDSTIVEDWKLLLVER